ncbi:bifunctional phosphopantothenoylcysteine decarboxylase/phosphopantothenate--cysteine ligase CoaBC [Paenibacillus macquariensis]|uniref:Coenzyme A biosynthesis bifunctional protein CoaBC n=1 Tax=Paenibacillus macquariensis TaxID=948756 RepID=A0ABY1JL23_9BACL|nr:bifunctional phosphopantothenoylcysteine decarboxylase/phosphopantothenate--cysteine ligase CoaBC [Paenibacillus macquariensis]MEC0090056.1 bifunctional phosphopantothenoylcysteine decarboxylase/phosphopantothenate--cysteine ligase CoaBC [Paenibacillus macquariensis]OAB31063.1 phosphopantothenoylcysteine decarboxylase [Paenibacillus macquariensis subsp. macquariensis]SIQ36866.1 phosphopantothenoylcysteine decarboxylase / phosphopantothenate--cysteine ligase [Paenibacillus macquariensis]
MLNGKKIVLGVTGGIAAYKAATLCSKLVQKGADVHVIMTSSAQQFITELTLQSLSKNPVYSDTFDEREPSVVSHINLADLADLVIVAPATANMIAKMAHGLADDMLSTTLLATTAPIMVAPAMNVHMYQHPAVIENMRILESRGVSFIEPGEGLLACGYVGKGRMEEPESIVQVIEQYFTEEIQDKPRLLEGKKIIVTAGGTIERIDPVRYITNDSSGKMGIAIAKVARDMGAEVSLVVGHIDVAPPKGIHVIPVQSAQDMYDAILELWENTDVVIKAAAVADYRPRNTADQKMKKSGETMTLEMVKTVDILEQLGQMKKSQFLIGFAAETNDVETYTREKLIRKNCDLMVANDVTTVGAGFRSDTNIVQIYDKNGLVEQLPMLSKEEVAHRLLSVMAQRLCGVHS